MHLKWRNHLQWFRILLIQNWNRDNAGRKLGKNNLCANIHLLDIRKGLNRYLIPTNPDRVKCDETLISLVVMVVYLENTFDTLISSEIIPSSRGAQQSAFARTTFRPLAHSESRRVKFYKFYVIDTKKSVFSLFDQFRGCNEQEYCVVTYFQ